MEWTPEPSETQAGPNQRRVEAFNPNYLHASEAPNITEGSEKSIIWNKSQPHLL